MAKDPENVPQILYLTRDFPPDRTEAGCTRKMRQRRAREVPQVFREVMNPPVPEESGLETVLVNRRNEQISASNEQAIHFLEFPQWVAQVLKDIATGNNVEPAIAGHRKCLQAARVRGPWNDERRLLNCEWVRLDSLDLPAARLGNQE